MTERRMSRERAAAMRAHLEGEASAYSPLARPHALEALREVDILRAEVQVVGTLLANNGCDCDCEHHPEEHNEDCERCLACRIADALSEAFRG